MKQLKGPKGNAVKIEVEDLRTRIIQPGHGTREAKLNDKILILFIIRQWPLDGKMPASGNSEDLTTLTARTNPNDPVQFLFSLSAAY